MQLCTWMHPVAHLYMDGRFERPTMCHINDADIAQKLQLLLFAVTDATNWWPHSVLGALWTRRPIVKVTMGCRTKPATVHIAHVLQKLHFFQFFNFFCDLHNLPQKEIHAFTAK